MKELRVPGDKSISHRALLVASMASGESRIRGLCKCDDVLATVSFVRALGVEVSLGDAECLVKGAGIHALSEPEDVLDARNSGTTARIGAGLLAGRPFFSVLTGDSSLRRRPMGRVVGPLRSLGASIEGRNSGSLLPVAFLGGRLSGGRVVAEVPSAQVKSAVILAGLRANDRVEVQLPGPSRDHTERMLAQVGARVESVGRFGVSVEPVQTLEPFDLVVPGDFSSAAFFMAYAAAIPGKGACFLDLGVNPTRTGLLSVLGRMGARIVLEDERSWGGEPVANVVVEGSELCGARVGPDDIPLMIDEVPALCIAASLASGVTEIRGARELRVKESDRIRAMARVLATLGVPCEELEDGLRIEGLGPQQGGIGGGRELRIETMHDHRIAMAAQVLAQALGFRALLDDRDCVRVSYPGFFRDLEVFLAS